MTEGASERADGAVLKYVGAFISLTLDPRGGASDGRLTSAQPLARSVLPVRDSHT